MCLPCNTTETVRLPRNIEWIEFYLFSPAKQSITWKANLFCSSSRAELNKLSEQTVDRGSGMDSVDVRVGCSTWVQPGLTAWADSAANQTGSIQLKSHASRWWRKNQSYGTWEPPSSYLCSFPGAFAAFSRQHQQSRWHCRSLGRLLMENHGIPHTAMENHGIPHTAREREAAGNMQRACHFCQLHLAKLLPWQMSATCNFPENFRTDGTLCDYA